MKKIFVLLVMLLSFPIFVKAEESVVITKVELENKTDSTIVIEEPTFNIRKINFNLKFSEVGDYAEYKVTLKNNSDKDYEIKSESNYLDSEYIKYEFSYGDSNILKAKEEKSIYIKLLYNKKVSEEHFVDGKYILNDSVKLDLVNDSIVVKVPPTHKGYSMFMVILGIFSLTISFILLILIKDEKVKSLLLICLLIIPFTVLALESISLEVDSKIEIVSKFTGTIYRWSTTEVKNGDSIVPVSETKWIIVADGEEDNDDGEENYVYDTHEQCTEFLSSVGITEGVEVEGHIVTCEQKTETFGGEIGEYTTDASTLNKTYYLKHDVVDDKITASYVCFVYNNAEHCMKGGDRASYSANQQILRDFQTFNNLPDNTSPGCYWRSSSSNCYGGGFSHVDADSDGHVSVTGSSYEYCSVGNDVNSNLFSRCGNTSL